MPNPRYIFIDMQRKRYWISTFDGGRMRVNGLPEFFWIIAGIWIAFLGWLFIPALFCGGSKPQKISRTYVHRSLLIFAVVIAVFIVGGRVDPGISLVRFVPDTAIAGLAGTVLTVIGLGFSVWARLHLGKNWSSMVMIKEEHQLIRTGPYRFVRNPMYTGMLTAYIGVVIALGILAGLFALVILIISLWIKISAEEEMLQEAFGEEYEQYRRDVKAIIPFIV